MSAEKILVIDDDPQIRRVMRVALSDHGYEVIVSQSGEEALDTFRAELPSLVLVDLNMPGMSGFETCRLLRDGSQVPIIVLSVRNAEKDIIQALDEGADDYVIKPFRVEELLARIRAALRRSPTAHAAQPRVLVLDEVEIDFQLRQVTAKGASAHLTPKEFDLLRYLVSHSGKVISHRRLLQAVWGPDYGNEVDYLRVFINQLRKKIEPNPSKPKFILTEPRVGYRFVSPDKA